MNQASSNGEATALSLACANGKMEAVEMLLAHGANPNVVLKVGFVSLRVLVRFCFSFPLRSRALDDFRCD